MPRPPKAGPLRLAAALAVLTALFLLPSCAWMQSLGEDKDPGPPPEAQIYWNKAILAKADGRVDMAAVGLEEAVRLDPNMYHAYYQLGLIYRDQGHKEKARVIWEAGLDKARTGPERDEYPRMTSLAQLQSALAALAVPSTREPSRASSQKKRPRAKSRKVKKTSRPKGGYAVLYSSNLRIKNARSDATKLKNLGYGVKVRTHKIKGRKYHRVWVGCCTTLYGAKKMALQMRKKGIKNQLSVMRYK